MCCLSSSGLAFLLLDAVFSAIVVRWCGRVWQIFGYIAQLEKIVYLGSDLSSRFVFAELDSYPGTLVGTE